MRFDIHVHNDGSDGPEILEEIRALREEVQTMASDVRNEFAKIQAQAFEIESVVDSAVLTFERLAAMIAEAVTLEEVKALGVQLESAKTKLATGIAGTPQQPGTLPS